MRRVERANEAGVEAEEIIERLVVENAETKVMSRGFELEIETDGGGIEEGEGERAREEASGGRGRLERGETVTSQDEEGGVFGVAGVVRRGRCVEVKPRLGGVADVEVEAVAIDDG